MLFGAIVEERTVKKNKNGDAEAKTSDDKTDTNSIDYRRAFILDCS